MVFQLKTSRKWKNLHVSRPGKTHIFLLNLLPAELPKCSELQFRGASGKWKLIQFFCGRLAGFNLTKNTRKVS